MSRIRPGEYTHIMTGETLRSKFAAEVGQRDYQRFLVAGVTGRLRFWQERMISNFMLAHPELNLLPGELETALRVCEVHGDELVPGSVPGVAAEIDYAHNAESKALFPRANVGPVGLGTGATERPIPIWFCASCRRAYAEWFRRSSNFRQAAPQDTD